MLIKDQFGIIQNLQTSPILQASFLVGTFFAVSYSKPALVITWGRKWMYGALLTAQNAHKPVPQMYRKLIQKKV